MPIWLHHPVDLTMNDKWTIENCQFDYTRDKFQDVLLTLEVYLENKWGLNPKCLGLGLRIKYFYFLTYNLSWLKTSNVRHLDSYNPH